MDIEQRKIIYKDSIDNFGQNLQFDVSVEECSELIKAIIKLKRNATIKNLNDLCEEIADVEIIIEQLRYIASCLHKENLIDTIKEEKLIRLKNLIVSHKNKNVDTSVCNCK